jgi:hypothetical protein
MSASDLAAAATVDRRVAARGAVWGEPGLVYIYNVVTSAVSVLFSEPNAVVFRVTSAVSRRGQ